MPTDLIHKNQPKHMQSDLQETLELNFSDEDKLVIILTKLKALIENHKLMVKTDLVSIITKIIITYKFNFRIQCLGMSILSITAGNDSNLHLSSYLVDSPIIFTIINNIRTNPILPSNEEVILNSMNIVLGMIITRESEIIQKLKDENMIPILFRNIDSLSETNEKICEKSLKIINYVLRRGDNILAVLLNESNAGKILSKIISCGIWNENLDLLYLTITSLMCCCAVSRDINNYSIQIEVIPENICKWAIRNSLDDSVLLQTLKKGYLSLMHTPYTVTKSKSSPDITKDNKLNIIVITRREDLKDLIYQCQNEITDLLKKSNKKSTSKLNKKCVKNIDKQGNIRKEKNYLYNENHGLFDQANLLSSYHNPHWQHQEVEDDFLSGGRLSIKQFKKIRSSWIGGSAYQANKIELAKQEYRNFEKTSNTTEIPLIKLGFSKNCEIKAENNHGNEVVYPAPKKSRKRITRPSSSEMKGKFSFPIVEDSFCPPNFQQTKDIIKLRENSERIEKKIDDLDYLHCRYKPMNVLPLVMEKKMLRVQPKRIDIDYSKGILLAEERCFKEKCIALLDRSNSEVPYIEKLQNLILAAQILVQSADVPNTTVIKMNKSTSLKTLAHDLFTIKDHSITTNGYSDFVSKIRALMTSAKSLLTSLDQQEGVYQKFTSITAVTTKESSEVKTQQKQPTPQQVDRNSVSAVKKDKMIHLKQPKVSIEAEVAALKIQKITRKHLKRKSATSQQHTRAFEQSPNEQVSERQRSLAAIRLQKVSRGHLARRKIQKHKQETRSVTDNEERSNHGTTNKNKVFHNDQHLELAAIQVQKVARGHLTRKQLRNRRHGRGLGKIMNITPIVEKDKDLKNEILTGICQEENAKCQNAAITVQKVARGHLTRKKIQKSKLENRKCETSTQGGLNTSIERPITSSCKAEEAAAAVTIQKIARGRRTRKHLQRGCSENNEEDKIVKGDRRDANYEETAAITIQKVARGRKARKEIAELKKKPKADLRTRFEVRRQERKSTKNKLLEDKRIEEAAIKIQKISRGHLQRKLYKEKKKILHKNKLAVAKIESFYLVYLATKISQKLEKKLLCIDEEKLEFNDFDEKTKANILECLKLELEREEKLTAAETIRKRCLANQLSRNEKLNTDRMKTKTVHDVGYMTNIHLESYQYDVKDSMDKLKQLKLNIEIDRKKRHRRKPHSDYNSAGSKLSVDQGSISIKKLAYEAPIGHNTDKFINTNNHESEQNNNYPSILPADETEYQNEAYRYVELIPQETGYEEFNYELSPDEDKKESSTSDSLSGEINNSILGDKYLEIEPPGTRDTDFRHEYHENNYEEEFYEEDFVHHEVESVQSPPVNSGYEYDAFDSYDNEEEST